MTPGERASGLGLTSAEAEARRDQDLGKDTAAPTSRPLSVIIRANVFTRFNAILGLLMAVIIVVGPFQDGLFAFVLVLNTLIGIGQEVRAKLTLDRLALLNVPRVRVHRDGVVVQLAVREIVVDDIIEVERGDQIPVDGVVVDGSLELDESLLTGETDPVDRSPGAALQSGSFVTAGSGCYRAAAVGSQSYAQRVAGEARRFALARSELEDGVNRMLRLIQWTLVPVATLLVVSQLASHRDLADAVRGCVAGIGAMIPEGLVLLTTVTFAVAVIRLARHDVLVQELPAVEGLARVDVLCLDKTGTLTRGGMDAEGVDLVGAEELAVVEAALGALGGAEVNPNPTLAAIASRWPGSVGATPVGAVPFSSARRWSGVDLGAGGVWVLGAPDVLLASTTAPTRAAIDTLVSAAAASGRRVVLLTRSAGPLAADALPPDLAPVAIARLVERVRDDARGVVEYLATQSVAVKVLSGDHPATVAAIAAAVGVPGADDPVDAGRLRDDELVALLDDRSVFGRVSPAQKRIVVGALQAAGHTVAMTGDGVNDVLALKDADIGVAMGSGSPAARAVAQIILLEDSLAAMPAIVGEGRRVMSNVERAANLFITKTVYATVIALVVGLSGVAYPFLPRHITIVSDFSIGIPAFVLALLPGGRRFRPGFVDRVLRFAIPCGVVIGASTLVAYFIAYHANLDLREGRTVATVVLAALGLWILSILARPLEPAKVALVAVMVASVGLLLVVPPVRQYFALQLPPTADAAVAAVIVVVTGGVLELLYRRLRVAAGLD